jgi:flagellar motor component MotA
MKTIFAVLGAALVIAAIKFGTDLIAFIDAVSLILVLGLTVCVPLANFSVKEVGAAVSAAMSSGPLDATEGHRHVSVLQTVRMAAAGSGVVGTFIGLIQMLHSLDAPTLIGPDMAVALLTFLYGITLSEFVVGPWINRIQHRVTAPADGSSKPASPNATAHVTGILSVLFCFFVLLYAISHG